MASSKIHCLISYALVDRYLQIGCFKYNYPMNFDKSIHRVDNAVSEDNCTLIIKYMDLTCKEKAKTLVGNKILENKNHRDVYNYGLNPNNNEDKPYIKIILDVMQKELIKYMNIFSFLKEVRVQDMQLLKYEVGHFYKSHIDSFYTVNRQLSFIINLNDTYEGGNIIFKHPTGRHTQKIFDLKKGDLLIFPSNFMYPHEVSQVTKGTRYSIVSWYA